jgi:hypothetical protein
MFNRLPESGSRPFILDDDDGFRADHVRAKRADRPQEVLGAIGSHAKEPTELEHVAITVLIGLFHIRSGQADYR